jgi:hypothetical protein
MIFSSNKSAFYRYLQILECPFVDEIYEESVDTIIFQELLITWLEDRKIREKDIGERDFLKLSTYQGDVNQWSQGINVYGQLLGCPYSFIANDESEIKKGTTYQLQTSLPSCNRQFILWLLSLAVSYEYEDQLSNEEPTNAAAIVKDNEEMEVIEEEMSADYASLFSRCEELGKLLKINQNKEEGIIGKNFGYVNFLVLSLFLLSSSSFVPLLSLLIFLSVFLCLPVSSCVFLCLPVSSCVFLCLPVNRVCSKNCPENKVFFAGKERRDEQHLKTTRNTFFFR